MEEAMYFEDYQVGSERQSYGRTITEADIVIHAGQTGDFFPHHMDKEWCKTQPFGQRMAHGTLIFSIAVGMTANLINPLAMSYGYDHLRFIKPVFIGDTLKTTTRVSKKEDSPKRKNMGIVYETLTVKNQHDEVVMVCDHLLMCEKQA